MNYQHKEKQSSRWRKLIEYILFLSSFVTSIYVSIPSRIPLQEGTNLESSGFPAITIISAVNQRLLPFSIHHCIIYYTKVLYKILFVFFLSIFSFSIFVWSSSLIHAEIIALGNSRKLGTNSGSIIGTLNFQRGG